MTESHLLREGLLVGIEKRDRSGLSTAVEHLQLSEEPSMLGSDGGRLES